MRLVIWWLLIPLTAGADTRLGVNAAGGFEGAMLRHLRPEPVAEAGISVEHLWTGKRWGPAASYERIGRGYDDVAGEWKLDAGICVSNPEHTNRLIVGLGVRSLTIPGGENRLPSTIRGFDLLRIAGDVQIIRRGPISLDFTLGWTFGIYHGQQYDERVGDVPQTTRGVTALTTAYVFGVQTTVALD